jgi:hypothetical protein
MTRSLREGVSFMGILNLLKANFTGKVGQVVGAKWKNKSTIRSYTKPAYTSTPAQQVIRQGFGEIASYVALFADQIRSLSALNTKGMSVRNAIIRLNKEMVILGHLNESELLISRGGLPTVSSFAASIPAGRTAIAASWTAAQGATISEKAKLVIVAVDDTSNTAIVGSALNSLGAVTIPATIPTGITLNVYYYLIDYRGSSRIASVSQHTTV